jgi:hypothetical protein
MGPDPSIFTRLGERWGLVGSDMQVLIACERGRGSFGGSHQTWKLSSKGEGMPFWESHLA